MSQDWSESKRALVYLRKARKNYDIIIQENSEEDWEASLSTESGEVFVFLPDGFAYTSDNVTSEHVYFKDIVAYYFQTGNQPRRWVVDNFSDQIKTLADSFRFERSYYDTLKVELANGERILIEGDFRIQLSRLIQTVMW